MTWQRPISPRGPESARDPASDERVVEEVLQGDLPRFEILMRRYNARLFRTARSILRDDAEAEDVVQQAYLNAYEHLGQFDGRARFATWLNRIAVHEALRRRDRRRLSPVEPVPVWTSDEPIRNQNPERWASDAELRRLLQEVIEGLPDGYRVVLVLRDVEELSTRETADTLGLSEGAVKVRLHRARQVLREALETQVDTVLGQLYGFDGERCERMVRAVFARLTGDRPA